MEHGSTRPIPLSRCQGPSEKICVIGFMKQKKQSDLAIAVGTSMCGLTADDVFVKCCSRGSSLGGVIIGFQQTQYDDISSLRIFARTDIVCSLLAREMGLEIPPLNW